MTSKRLSDAIDELASEIPNGELLAATDQVSFLKLVTEEIRGLRAKVSEMKSLAWFTPPGGDTYCLDCENGLLQGHSETCKFR